MIDQPSESSGTLPRVALWLMVLMAGGLVLAYLTRETRYWVLSLFTIVTEGGLAAMVVIAAGGYGFLAVRRVAPGSAPLGLVVVTGCGLGLWMLGTLVLLAGSLVPGALSPWVWWPVVGSGVLAAAWLGRKRMEAWQIPKRFDGRALVWVLVALAVGLWLTGATRPPGTFFGVPDEYDVLEYHLQVPREYYDTGHVAPLRHNVYSHYPLGVEMLFLLGMCLRDGGYNGMYLAKLLHGAFAVLAVGAVFVTLKRDQDTRARLSAAFLATTPFVIYLSWMAMVELAEVFYLALGVLWLREWIRGGGVRSAWCVGLAMGGACAAKYLSVGFVVAPIVAVMLALSGRPQRRAAHVLPALLAAGVLLSPWLIRNLIATGNPVFPLATRIFGAGYWSHESQQRWEDGHGPRELPPVPKPPDWEPPPWPSRLERLYRNFLRNDSFGTLMLMTAGVGVCVVLAMGTRADPWSWALIGILAVQVIVWVFFTHGMPDRFLVPAVVPLALLAGGALADLARVPANPFRRKSASPGGQGHWGRPPAVVIFVVTAAVSLLIAHNIYATFTSRRLGDSDELVQIPIHGVPGQQLVENTWPLDIAAALPRGHRILLVGEAQAFYFPPGTVYATVWDESPLAPMAREGSSARQVLRDLREREIGYVWVNWAEMWRLANTYGLAKPFSEDLFARWQGARPAGLDVLDKLKPAGLKPLMQEGSFAARPFWDPKAPPVSWPVFSLYALPGAPVTTLPTTPPPATRPAPGV